MINCRSVFARRTILWHILHQGDLTVVHLLRWGVKNVMDDCRGINSLGDRGRHSDFDDATLLAVLLTSLYLFEIVGFFW